MEKIIKKDNNIPFSELVKAIELIAKSLKLNKEAKNIMYKKFFESYGQPTKFLEYEEIKKEVKENIGLECATELLRDNELEINVNKFNNRMRELGYLETKQRETRKKGLRYYNVLTEKGLEYGKNIKNLKYLEETRPLYYKNKFEELFYKLFKKYPNPNAVTIYSYDE